MSLKFPEQPVVIIGSTASVKLADAKAVVTFLIERIQQILLVDLSEDAWRENATWLAVTQELEYLKHVVEQANTILPKTVSTEYVVLGDIGFMLSLAYTAQPVYIKALSLIQTMLENPDRAHHLHAMITYIATEAFVGGSNETSSILVALARLELTGIVDDEERPNYLSVKGRLVDDAAVMDEIRALVKKYEDKL